MTEILSNGAYNALGGTPNVYNILENFEKFSQSWVKHTYAEGLDTLSVLEVKYKLDREFHALRKTSTKSSYLKILNDYLHNYPEICVVAVNKSNDFFILLTFFYQKKLEAEFRSNEF